MSTENVLFVEQKPAVGTLLTKTNARSSLLCRAKTIDEQEKALRRRQQEEREKFRLEQQQLLKQKEEERRSQIQEKERARETYKEKMKNATQIEVSGDGGSRHLFIVPE